MRKIYLDIDGVLLTTKNTTKANDSEMFVKYITNNFDCYWLTTHCKDNNVSYAINYLSRFFSTEIIAMLKKIKPVYWNTSKTEAIDFDSDFYWVDDNPFEFEKRILEQHSWELLFFTSSRCRRPWCEVR